MSTDRGMDVVHIYNGESEVGSGSCIYAVECYSAIRKK